MAVKRKASILVLLAAFSIFSSCTPAPASPTETNSPSPIPSTPTPTSITPPQPTLDSGVLPYLENVEAVLRHSAVVVKDRAVGIPNACPAMYLMAFPYTEPDRRGGQTLQVTALERLEDGTIPNRDHRKLWNLKAEGVEPERCKDIFVQDRSEPGLIRISFQVQHPDDQSWRIGVASGTCLENDLWLAAYFILENPADFELILTQYSPDSAVDYWLRDGSTLHRYNWEPWQESLLWSLENVPGNLAAVEYDQESEDLTGDSLPDLLITWQTEDQLIKWVYSPVGDGFDPIGEFTVEGGGN
jgi:hypothetical protein